MAAAADGRGHLKRNPLEKVQIRFSGVPPEFKSENGSSDVRSTTWQRLSPHGLIPDLSVRHRKNKKSICPVEEARPTPQLRSNSSMWNQETDIGGGARVHKRPDVPLPDVPLPSQASQLFLVDLQESPGQMGCVVTPGPGLRPLAVVCHTSVFHDVSFPENPSVKPPLSVKLRSITGVVALQHRGAGFDKDVMVRHSR
ncbi:unnamed protein product [Pleuronectes platessa]|uniref:Uncharacterized protein n=1 Tax=Pleuronectes platessa TaxID=8262 RepID=A0A9N7W3D2_PLEPL|nr:unnamed protein product [Pleuronectes platessa]